MSHAAPHAAPGPHALWHWWKSPGGGSEVLKIAFPMVISSLSWTVMTFVDRVFLNQQSGAAMSAAFSASMLWFSLLCLPLGITMYCCTFVSQYFGNDQRERVGVSVWQGVWVAALCTPLMLLAIPLAEPLFSLGGHEQHIRELEVTYFQVLCWGAPGMLFAQAFSSFYAGRGQTRVMMIVDASAAALNVLLDYWWIFGKAGFPAMGIAGAGWATVAALWIKALVYLVLILLPANRRAFGTWRGMLWDREIFTRLIYYGAPSGFQLVLDVVGFTVFVMMVGRLGTIEAEATSMAFSISTLAFMPIWGLAQTASILVGQRLGENNPRLAERSTWTTLVLSLIYMAVVSTIYVVAPAVFLTSFVAEGAGRENSAAVLELAKMLLRFVAAYNLLDATAMVFVSAIKGAGDTPFVLRISLIWAAALASLSWLGVEVLEFGIYGCWLLISAWVCSLGMIFMWRFVGGAWKAMRVIDMEPTPPADLTGINPAA